MANLKEIRNRISSVSSTMQITNAMKMVSAAKLKKAQDAIVAMRPYSNKLTGILQDLSSSIDSDNVFIQNTEANKTLIICITSNRGLCGGFNSNIIKKCVSLASNKNQEVSFLCLGKKGSDILSKKHNVILTKNEIFEDMSFENVKEIADLLIQKFVDKEFEKIQIVYNRFKNAATQIITNEQFLPILPADDQQENNKNYIFAPNHSSFMDFPVLFVAINKYLVFVAKKELKKIPIFKSILNVSGFIFVDRDNTSDAIDSLNELKSDIKNTPRSVVVFPEGTRSSSNQLQSFKKGAAVLSINTGLPIIPVYIMGSFDWWDTKNFRKNSNKIVVNFGKPIITENKQYEDRENITNSIKKEIIKLQNNEI